MQFPVKSQIKIIKNRRLVVEHVGFSSSSWREMVPGRIRNLYYVVFFFGILFVNIAFFLKARRSGFCDEFLKLLIYGIMK